MPNRSTVLWMFSTAMFCLASCSTASPNVTAASDNYTLDYETLLNPVLQGEIEGIDAELRVRHGMTAEQVAVGVLDLKTLRLAMIHPDRGEYAASVPKIGILLAWLLRYFLLLEQGKLISPQASKAVREVLESPDIPHDRIKFVEALSDRGVQIVRKWGSREDWRHDAAVIIGSRRHYILVALTHHPKGDAYLVDLAKSVDDLMAGVAAKK